MFYTRSGADPDSSSEDSEDSPLPHDKLLLALEATTSADQYSGGNEAFIEAFMDSLSMDGTGEKNTIFLHPTPTSQHHSGGKKAGPGRSVGSGSRIRQNLSAVVRCLVLEAVSRLDLTTLLLVSIRQAFCVN